MMNTDILGRIDPKALGKKLRLAREKKGLTQEQAAQIIGVVRTTVVAIEKGERRVRQEELIQLAVAYDRQISDFLKFPQQQDSFTDPQFRGPEGIADSDSAKLEYWVERLKDLSFQYYELEQLVGNPLPRKYPQEYEIGNFRIDQEAEMVAIEERNRLSLGDGPIHALRSLLEHEVGLRIFYLPIEPVDYSAIYVYSDKIGGCIAINSKYPDEERNRMSLSHDYGHFLTARNKPQIITESWYGNRPESERFSSYFAPYFLMPASGLKRRFNDMRRGHEFSAGDLALLANYFGVSVEAVTRRLEEMRVLPSGTWHDLQQEGFKVHEVQRQLGIQPYPKQNNMLPSRFTLLAIEALRDGKISEGYFAELLNVDRLEARAIVSQFNDPQALEPHV